MGDPQIVVSHMVDLFLRYPQDRVDRAIVRLVEENEFLPRIAKIKQTLDDEVADLRREEERQSRPLMLPEPPIDRSSRLSYAELCSKYGGDGKGDWGMVPKEPKPDPFMSIAQLKEIAGGKWDEIPDRKLNDWKKVS